MMRLLIVKVEWKPYLLNKDTPPEGYDLKEYLKNKYGDEAVARFESPNNPLDEAGSRVGITFNKSRRIVNSIDCHRIMEWCYGNYPEKANDLMECMFRSYFIEGKNLNDRNILVNLVANEGFDQTSVKQALEGENFQDSVTQSDVIAKRQWRVSGVPYFIFERQDGGRPTVFSGAQPTDIIAEVLEEVSN